MANQNVTQLTQQTVSAAPSSLFYAVTGGATDTGLPLSVLFNSPAFTGIPVVPTAAVDTSTTQIASTAYVVNQAYLKLATATATYAPIASPTFTGTVTIPTVTVSAGTIDNTSVGATTPNTGSFTTLTASSTVSGVGFSNYLASPPGIGGSTPAAGKFTTLQATAAITPSSTSGIVGTITNDNANAGSIGEFISNSASASSVTNNVAINGTSISLTAGDWDVTGHYKFNTTTASLTACAGGISTTSATFGGIGTLTNMVDPAGTVTTNQFINTTGVVRLSLASTTTVFLVASATFAAGTVTVDTLIRARRVR